MSTSSVCQGLQSCLEPGLAEPRVLRLKLAIPSSAIKDTQFNHPRPEVEVGPHRANRAAMDGLSFLQALAIPVPDAAAAKVYVHPMVKRSASMLSAKSLEMCTESLGSETGSGDEMSVLPGPVIDRHTDTGSAQSQSPAPARRRALRAVGPARRTGRGAGGFPPPLASVGGLKVRPHREEGRLVLRAVAVEPTSSCFHAERADGRLRLRLRSFSPSRGGGEGEVEDGAEAEDEVSDGDYEDEGDETEDVLGGGGEGENERNGNVGVKMGEEKLERYGRCKEDGCGNNNRVLLNCNQQPYLVAT